MGRALVVDDMALNRRMITLTLARDGITTDEADDVRSALTFLDANVYDVVLLDLALARGDSGYQVLETIRARPDLDGLPVILVTGSMSDRASIAHGLLAGAHDCLTKPFEPDELRARVAAARRTVSQRARGETKVDAKRNRGAPCQGRVSHSASMPPMPFMSDAIAVSGDVVTAHAPSGDLFDVVTDRNGAVHVVMIDVAAHGAMTASAASAARRMVRQALLTDASTRDVVDTLREGLAARGGPVRVHAAFGLLRFDLEGGSVEALNAGLPPFICLRPDGQPSFVSSASSPVGLFARGTHATDTMALPPGSVIAMMSDGLTGGAIDVEASRLAFERMDFAVRGPALATAGSADVRGVIQKVIATMRPDAHEGAALVVARTARLRTVAR